MATGNGRSPDEDLALLRADAYQQADITLRRVFNQVRWDRMKVDGRDDGTMVTTGSSVELFTSPAELSEVIRDEAAAPAMDGRTRPGEPQNDCSPDT